MSDYAIFLLIEIILVGIFLIMSSLILNWIGKWLGKYPDPHWLVITRPMDEEHFVYEVQWSEKTGRGHHFVASHHWAKSDDRFRLKECRVRAEREAAMLNEQGKHPMEFEGY